MVGSCWTQRATKMSIYNGDDDINNMNSNSNNNQNAVTATAVEKSVVFVSNNNNNNGVAVEETASVTTAQVRINLAALQQRDPYITDIVDTTKQVALYSFNFDKNEWERTSIEGSLFVYKRSACPNHGFMILNRLEPNNLIEPIQKELEFLFHSPFLLYRTPIAINGIWFYDEDECTRIGKLVKGLVQVAATVSEAKTQMAVLRQASDSQPINDRLSNVNNLYSMSQPVTKSMDIVQLLTKAQHDYNKVKEVQKGMQPILTDKSTCPSSIIYPTPVYASSSSRETHTNVGDRPEENHGSHISVETLFRNASVEQSGSRQIDSNTNAVQSYGAEGAAPATSKLPSIRKRLGMSVPMVEDLERQHRNEQPPSGANALPSSRNMTIYIPSSRTTKSTTQTQSTLMSTQSSSVFLQSSSQLKHGQTSISSNILNVPSTAKDVGPTQTVTTSQCSNQNLASIPPSHRQKNVSSVCNSPTNFLSLTSTGNSTKSSNIQRSLIAAIIRRDNSATFNNAHLASPSLEKIGSQNLLTPADMGTTPSSGISASGISGCSGASLLSPMAFVSQSSTSTSNSSNNLSEMSKPKNESIGTFLTKEQFRQALLYTIKNDSSFVSRIHEAYILSLNADISNINK